MRDEKAIKAEFALPPEAVNQQGLRYDPRIDIWPLSGPRRCHLNLSKYKKLCTPWFFRSLKLALITINAKVSSSTISLYLRSGINPFLARITQPLDKITKTQLEEYWISLSYEQKIAFSHLRALCRALWLNGIPGHSITQDAWDYIRKLTIPCHERGRAVAMMDPMKGPMTPDELDAFLRALHAGFSKGNVSPENYIIFLLFAAFGSRSSNLVCLKVCDLETTEINGKRSYALLIPRAKQRGGRFRSSFRKRPLYPELGVLLEGWVELQKAKLSTLGSEADLPLFADPDNHDPIRRYHRSTSQMSNNTINLAKRLAVWSNRTNSSLIVNPQRFRRTLATCARAMGWSPSQIADLLDHRNINTQEIYAAISPQILSSIEERMRYAKGPLAAAFLGQLANPNEPMLPGALIYPTRFREEFEDPSLGQCTASRMCGGRKPYACYVCTMFQASMEGDHEGVLTDLETERLLFNRDASTCLIYLTVDSIRQAVCSVITMRDDRLREMGKTLEMVRQERDDRLRDLGALR